MGRWAAGLEMGRAMRGAPLQIMFADRAFLTEVVAVVGGSVTGRTPTKDVRTFVEREVV